MDQKQYNGDLKGQQLIYTFSRRPQRIIKNISAILLLILSILFLSYGFFRESNIQIQYLIPGLRLFGIICLFYSTYTILQFTVPSDINLFKDGLEYKKKVGLFSFDFIKIHFKGVLEIKMITIPINIKCVVIKQNDGDYRITGKEINNIEDFYLKVLNAYNSFHSDTPLLS